MSEIKQQQAVKAKKPVRITLAVSKRNCNRVKFGTHSVEKVLKLEGHVLEKGCVLMGDRLIPLNSIDLTSRHKDQVIPLVKKEAPAPQPVPAQAAAN